MTFLIVLTNLLTFVHTKKKEKSVIILKLSNELTQVQNESTTQVDQNGIVYGQ